MPQDALTPYLNYWRFDQYHVSWDRWTEFAPLQIWSRYEVITTEYIKYCTVPLVADFCFQTHPFFGMSVNTNSIDVEVQPPCVRPIKTHLSTVDVPPFFTAVADAMEMLDHCILFFPSR